MEFECAFCHRKVTAKDFPYKYGWKYLYGFMFKESKDLKMGIRDQHFCSFGCLQAFTKIMFENLYGKEKPIEKVLEDLDKEQNEQT